MGTVLHRHSEVWEIGGGAHWFRLTQGRDKCREHSKEFPVSIKCFEFLRYMTTYRF